MYDSKSGAFFYIASNDNNDYIYHWDNTYYIRYNSKKALFALEKLYADIDVTDSWAAAFYYHIYLDMLFNAVGLINDRFIIKKEMSKELKDNITRNRKEYDFNSETYYWLSDKSFRNFIEHINSRCDKLIKNGKYHGAFNFIHPNIKQKVQEALASNEKMQNNLLNLINKTYVILDTTDGSITRKVIPLDKLKQELESINERSNVIWEFLNDKIWQG